MLRIFFYSILFACSYIVITKIPVQLLFKATRWSVYAQEIKIVLLGPIIIFLAAYLAKRWKISRPGGFSHPNPRNYWFLLIPFAFPGILAFMSMGGDCRITNYFFISTVITSLIMGLSEELVFRGLSLGYLLSKNPGMSIHPLVFLNSLAFALGHFINLLSSNLPSVVNQVIYAFYMGILFSALLIKTKNVWLLGIAHGLLNILWSICPADYESLPHREFEGNFSDYAIQVLKTSLLFSPVLLIYFSLMKNKATPKDRGADFKK